MKRVQQDLKDAFSNDLYFENEVRAIEQHKQYVLQDELKSLINRVIINKLKTFTFNKTDDEKLFKLRQTRKFEIFDFIEQYYDKGNFELKRMLGEFKRKSPDEEILLTFDQDYAFSNKNVEYITVYHPLINAVANYFEKAEETKNNVFKFRISKNDVNNISNDVEISEGYYLLVNFNFTIEKDVNGKISNITKQKAQLIDLQNEDFDEIIMPENIADAVNAAAQINRENLFVEEELFDKDNVKTIKEYYKRDVYQQKQKLKEQETIYFESEKNRKFHQEVDAIDRRIQRLEENIETGKGLANPQLKEVDDLEEKKRKFTEANQNSKLDVNENLVSLNLVEIYG